MRARPTALACCVVAAARVASADTTVRGFATAGVGVSDNAAYQLGAETSRVVAATFELRPGVAAIIQEKRDRHLIGYALRLSLVASDAGTQTYANQLLWRWTHEATPRDRLTFDTSATVGRTSAFYLLATSGGPLAGATPQVTRFATARVAEVWARELSPSWALFQSVAGSAYFPLDDGAAIAQSWQLDAGLGAERTWKRDALRVDVAPSYVLYRAVDAPGAARAESRQVVAAATTRWRHELDRDFQTLVSAGIVALASADHLGQPVVGPVASATLRRGLEDGSIALTVAHTEASNLFLGQTQIVDEASVASVVPVDRRRRFRLLGAGAYGHARNVVGAGLAGADAAYHYYRVDVGLLHVISTGLRTSIHAQRVDQRPDASSAAAGAFVADSVFVDFTAVLPQPELSAAAPL